MLHEINARENSHGYAAQRRSPRRARHLLDAQASRTRQRAGAGAQLSGFPDRRRRLAPLRERALRRGVPVHRKPGDPPRGDGRRRPPHRHSQLAGRLPEHRRPHPSRRNSAARRKSQAGGKHTDITLTLDWMDAMGVDYCCMFPTPMLFLGLHPQVEIEAAMCDAYNAWLCERILAQRAAHRVDALPAVQRSGSGLQDGEEVRRQEGRGRLHGDVAALQAGARQRLHEDLCAARGDGQADLVPRRL